MNILLESKLAWLTIEQTCQAINRDASTLFRLRKAGKLQVGRFEGKKPLFHVSDIKKYIISTLVSEETADQRLLKARSMA